MSAVADRTAAAFASVTATAMIAQHVGGTATRDALFLTEHAPRDLPVMMVAGALVSLLGVALTTGWLDRWGPARVIPVLFSTSAALFVGEHALTLYAPAATAIVVYMHTAAFSAIVISGFWSIVNERFDPHAAKQLIGRITAGSTLGGIVGGLCTERVAALFDMRSMLLVLAGMNMLCAASLFGIGKAPKVAPGRKPAGLAAGISLIRDTPYLRQLAQLVALVAVVKAMLDFVFKVEVVAHVGEGEALLSFFALYYTATGILTFVVASGASRPVLERLGLGGAVALLPASVAAVGMLGALLSRLWAVVVLRATEAVVANALYRPGYELFYTPLPVEKKRPTKAIIDVAIARAGAIVGALFVMLVLWVAPTASGPWLIGTAMATAAGTWVLALRLHRGYVQELAASLSTGVVTLDHGDVIDATTRRTLSDTTRGLDRQQLLREIQHLRKKANATKAADQGKPSQPDDRLAIELRSDDPQRIRQALSSEALTASAMPLVLPLLGDERVLQEVTGAIGAVASTVVEPLIDALVNPEHPPVVRRRIPRLLAMTEDPRAVTGLLAGLTDARFEVRERCGRALARIAQGDAPIEIEQARAFDAVRREVQVSRRVWKARDALERDPPTEGDDRLDARTDAAVRERAGRSLRHVFRVLGLALRDDAMQVSLRALSGEDAGLRGTALEYLDNVLPGDIRDGLWPHIAAPKERSRSKRTREELLEVMLRSSASLEFDRASLNDLRARHRDGHEPD